MVKTKSKYALFWKGKKIPKMTFDSKTQATTAWRLETQQMELAEYSPLQLKRMLKVKKITNRTP